MASNAFRLEAHFSGRVQGVGFRYTTRQIAAGYEVTGRVRNLPDGRVHLIAEGAEAEVRDFLRDIQAQLIHHIKETKAEPLAGPPEFRDFHIG
ncbi:MAG TPA: acylphosphatase [Opitutales bacterium]|jgi:acylphosphatase|nr:acylphosphatase [Opitutales bacterium]